jgi:hypothetical protein
MAERRTAGGDSAATVLRRARSTIAPVELRGGHMTESSAEHPAPAPPATESKDQAQEDESKKRCDDPTEPYTAYLLAASVATKRSELYAAVKDKLDERYKKLDGAPQRFEDSWNAQKKPWESLKCQLQRILKALYGTVDEQQRKALKKCWCEIVAETDKDTKPVDCKEIKALSCKDLECNEPRPPIAELRRLEERAAACVKRYEAEFDKLAELPEKMEGLISDLTATATALEDAMAAPGSDPLRSYVAYLDLERAFRKLGEKLRGSATDYGCELKNAFVDLLDATRKLICVQVAVHEWSKRRELEEEAKKKKAGKVIDRVLECVPPTPTPPTEPQKPPKWESDCKPPDKGPKPKPSGEYERAEPGPEKPAGTAQ